jgi:hypothetical protein
MSELLNFKATRAKRRRRRKHFEKRRKRRSIHHPVGMITVRPQ